MHRATHGIKGHIIWNMFGKAWIQYVTKNHYSPIAEPEVNIPMMYFSGANGNEVHDLLTEKFYYNVVITPSKIDFL